MCFITDVQLFNIITTESIINNYIMRILLNYNLYEVACLLDELDEAGSVALSGLIVIKI